MNGPEYVFSESPIIDALKRLNYSYLPQSSHGHHRDGDTQVLLRPIILDALQRLNDISEQDAREAYTELLTKTDNSDWTAVLRGDYSRPVAGSATRKTIRVVDLLNPANNTFTVASQFYVRSQSPRKPDIVVFINGIPLVVIECKSPLSVKDKTGEAFEQIKQYERDIPRLFFSNAFNIVTNGQYLLYGTTASPSPFWASWKDPFPRTRAEFQGDDVAQGLWALLEPERLLDLLAHFIVFEQTPDGVVKKICRYQQFRAVNKMVDLVVAGKHRRGLIWHTQGSGKSLTMVFAALKLKTHRTIDSPQLRSPNLLIVTDRIDLDDQITGTFNACKLPNPISVKSGDQLMGQLHAPGQGYTVLSTIFKIAGSRTPVANSANWIVLADEAHRTQERDLGAYLRETLPDAFYFGFTGTPIKKKSLDTYKAFGTAGQPYLDKYGIDDAVADGATVPIHYLARKTEWQLHGQQLDIAFNNDFLNLDDERLNSLKKEGADLAKILKSADRIRLIATDIWKHYSTWALPDGFKAQIVCYDRESIILYRRALIQAIVAAQKCGEDEAAGLIACVYSLSQEDAKPSEDPHMTRIREELLEHYLDSNAEKEAKQAFHRRGEPPFFLIVCNKLLTGFDEPNEAAMYLDSPLQGHNLLQAIARINRTADEQKASGLVVDYIGVSVKLAEALAEYRTADVQSAMRDVEQLRSELRAAHAAVMLLMQTVVRAPDSRKDHLKTEYDTLVRTLGSEDNWFTFRRKAKDFIARYSALAPEPPTLDYTDDLKWIAGFLPYASQSFEKRESQDLANYSAKIRAMLQEHLKATGIDDTCKIRHITDPEFWEDFHAYESGRDLERAPIRKATELKKITREYANRNPKRYGKFSERVIEIITRLERAQIESAAALLEFEQVAKDLQAETHAHQESGLSERAYDFYRILEAFPLEAEVVDNGALKYLAQQIHVLYLSDETAPISWQTGEEARKRLRQAVRALVVSAGFREWKEIPVQIEEYAVSNYAKL